MRNAGFLNLPFWHRQLQNILHQCGAEEMLRLPVLGCESIERPWATLDSDDFYSVVQTGIHFNGKKLPERLPEILVTSDPVVALSRLNEGLADKTFYSSAIGNTSAFRHIFSDTHICARPEKIIVQNDAVAGYILGKMQSDGKTLEEASHEAQWEKIACESPNLNIHGFVCRDRLALQIVDVFGILVKSSEIPVSGFSSLENIDVKVASDMGYSIRLLGIAEYKNNALGAVVEPCVIPSNYLLAQARAGSEIMYLKNLNGESYVYSCPGTSYEFQAKLMLRDLNHCSADHEKRELIKAPVEETLDHFYIRFGMVDISKTLSQVLTLFSNKGIVVDNIHRSVLSVSRETTDCDPYCVVVFTGKSCRGEIDELVAQITDQVKLATVKSCLRLMPGS